MVLSAGAIVELDTPRNLMKKRGVFWRMLQESGDVDALIKAVQ
jgi:ABC-type multidrug transport system fused ATPase/permease subunit